MKRLLIIFLAVSCTLPVWGQKEERRKAKGMDLELSVTDTLTNEYLDSLNIRKKIELNDYDLLGVQYGAGLSQVIWNPSQKQEMVFVPVNFGITYTKYGKMFGYMPYFGFQIGLMYAKEGYQFKYNEDSDYTYKIEGAEKAIMDVVEVPMYFQFHLDFWKMKVMAQLGCFGGYRLAIERFPGKTGSVSEEMAHSFKDTDRRFDYGIKGGVGFGFVFDPIEIHIQAMYKHSLSSLYDPDHYSQYYYRFAYPSNIIVSAGVHFQLTKRTGKTKGQLKKLAREMVYKSNTTDGNTESQGR